LFTYVVSDAIIFFALADFTCLSILAFSVFFLDTKAFIVSITAGLMLCNAAA